MRNHLYAIAAISFFLLLSSCKKENNTPTPAPVTTPATTNDLYIKFDLDGVPKNITSTNVSITTGLAGSSFTSAGFFIFNNSIDISFNLLQDSILQADLQALVNQQIPIVDCLGCPLNAGLRYEINGDAFNASDLDNTFPANYFKITSVTYYRTVVKFGKSLKQFYVKGEFNANVTYGPDTKHLTNGTFRMIFEEAKG